MSGKTISPTAICFLVASFSITGIFAQQRKFIESVPARSFIYLQRSGNNTINNGIHLPYRSYDGTNNNLGYQKTDWGAADIALFREIPAEYGPNDPKNAMGGTTRPSPRKISNVVIDEPVTQFNERGLSAFVYVWGQFIDHDMSLTPTATTESVPIALPPDEIIFTDPIPFSRSEVRPGTGIRTVRDQTNLNTSWLDASMVYGTDPVRAKWLRTLKGGRMKTSTDNFLPYNTITGEKSANIDASAPSMANDSDHTVKTFVAGDVRAAEHPGILSLHTLFVREHNRICARLIAQGYRNDEEIYQKARKEVGAIIQAITYQEFLPAIGITLNGYSGYKSYVRPDITNTFATAGYRIGHTMVADDIMMFDNNCEEVGPGELDLLDAFWIPQLVVDYKPDPFLKGFAAHTQYETDTKINSVLRNFLFVNPNSPVRFGIDLGSLNIQRGRDHGLPNYNAVRKYYTGSKIAKFSQITSNTALASSLKNLYGTVDNIDLWIGILAEDHLPGKSVGYTMHKILKTQFENLRDGDFYFYKNDPYLPQVIKNLVSATKFSDVLKRNTSLTNLQANVFFTEDCPGHPSGEERLNTHAADKIIEDENPKVYPNPATNLINIGVGKPDQPTLIRIYNSNGMLVKTIRTVAGQQNIKMDISHFGTGMYIINIIKGKEVKSMKFIKPSN